MLDWAAPRSNWEWERAMFQMTWHACTVRDWDTKWVGWWGDWWVGQLNVSRCVCTQYRPKPNLNPRTFLRIRSNSSAYKISRSVTTLLHNMHFCIDDTEKVLFPITTLKTAGYPSLTETALHQVSVSCQSYGVWCMVFLAPPSMGNCCIPSQLPQCEKLI